MVYRVYVEKKEALANEARALLEDLRAFLGIQSLTGLRLFNRYDLEGISRELFDYAVQTVLSEPQLDTVTSEVPQGDTVFAVEYLPGQYDQRADSAAQCIQILSQGERPTVRTARVYVLEGELTAEQVEAVKKYVINPVESREASLELPETLRMEYDIPTTVRTVEGFTSMDAAALDALRDELGLAMDLDDLKFLQGYFRDDEGRDPTITEIRVVDTYWSDHCRHTTFSTHIDQVEIHDAAIQAAYERYLAARVEVYGEEKAAKRPQTLMDIATIGAKVLKKRGLLPELDESQLQELAENKRVGTAAIYYAFDNTINSTRYPYYAYMQTYWDSVGLQTRLDTTVTVSDLRRMGDYDLCILSTHGAYYTYEYGWLWERTATEPLILLSEKSEFWSDLRYGFDLLAHRVVKVNGMYAVNGDFFRSAYRGNGIVLSETCEFYGKNGHVDTAMADGLLAGGAKAVMGYVNNVYSVYSRSMLWATVNRMIEGETLEQAVDYAKSIYGTDDIIWYNEQGGRRSHAAASYAMLSGSRSAVLPNPYTAEEAAAAA